jgi:hypothetical protein
VHIKSLSKKTHHQLIAQLIAQMKYEFGCIYKLVSKQTKQIYVGSTTHGHGRFRMHQNAYNNRHKNTTDRQCETNYKAFELLQYDDCEMKLIEPYPCENNGQLKDREAFWMRHYFPEQCKVEVCINEKIPSSLPTKELNKQRIAKKREDPTFVAVEKAKKKVYRTTDKGKAEYERKNDARRIKAFQAIPYEDLSWFTHLCKNADKYFPVSVEQKRNKKRRYQKKWYLSRKK